MPNSQYCLRWNDHIPHFVSVFSSLLHNECLVDVTLAAEGKYLQAHKIVLSASSSYFQELFSVNPCRHPIVVLKDVSYQDLKSVIHFIYFGEVNVAQEQLHSIWKVAETLNIKGLADIPFESVVGNATVSEKRSVESPTLSRKRKLRKVLSDSSSTVASNLYSNEPTLVQEFKTGLIYVKEENFEATINDNFSREDSTQNGFRSFESTSYEEQHLSPAIEVPPTVSIKSKENVGSISVITGTKKRHRLQRQQQVPLKTEPDEEDTCGGAVITSPKRPLVRQYSDPTPQQNTTPNITSLGDSKSNLLTIPNSHLSKQNSDSALPPPTESRDVDRSVTDDLLQQSLSQNSHPRSNHCPMLRPGPALGCNFCWNTIDNHGRILRRKTKYHCPECRTNLCIVPCFQDYHLKREQKSNDEDKNENEASLETFSSLGSSQKSSTSSSTSS